MQPIQWKKYTAPCYSTIFSYLSAHKVQKFAIGAQFSTLSYNRKKYTLVYLYYPNKTATPTIPTIPQPLIAFGLDFFALEIKENS